MKKILSLIFLPLIAIMFLCGCGEKGDVTELQKLYTQVTTMYVVEGENIFFNDTNNPHTISIAYTDGVKEAIDIENPTTVLQKRYRTFHYNQVILNNIFNLYENNSDNFYKVMSNSDYKEKEIENLYSKLTNLKDSLIEFKSSYDIFIEQTKVGLSDVLDINLKNFTYELNKITEKSFDFMYEFVGVYEKYCIEDKNATDVATLNYRIDKAYMDLAHIVYLENFKTFSTTVADKGVCDLTKLIDLDNKFNLLDDIGDTKKLSNSIIVNLDAASDQNLNAMNLVNDFVYASNLFDQNYSHYINAYNKVYNDESNTIKQYNNYRFGLIGGGSLESFLNGLSATDRAQVNMLTNFISECYNNLHEKLILIVE